MEAKKMARKIEEYFFTKENKVNLNFKFELDWICNNLNYQGQIENELLSIKRIETIFSKLGMNVVCSKIKDNGKTIIIYSMDKKDYNKIKKFLVEYRKFISFAKEINLEHKYPISVIIDYIADNIYVNE